MLQRLPTAYATLVLAELHTGGRTHQIRRPLRRMSHPVLGDRTHGDNAHNNPWRDDRGLERLFLHALTLRLPAGDGSDDVGAELFVRAPLPDDLRGVLERLPEAPLQAPPVREALELT